MSKQHWTKWEQEALVNMWAEEKPVSEISIVIGRSDKSIYHYVHRNRDRLCLDYRKKRKHPDAATVMPTREGKRFWMGLIDRFLK